MKPINIHSFTSKEVLSSNLDSTYADVYFNRSKSIVIQDKNKSNIKVRYRVFFRDNGIACGFNRAVQHILRNADDLKIWSLIDGEYFKKNQTVMIIEGYAENLLPLETIYLGMISLSGPATGMKKIVDVANGVPVIDMSARHYLPEMIKELAYAAKVGGAIGTSTQAGFIHATLYSESDNFDFDVFGSIPHALNAIYDGSSIEAAIAYHNVFPNIPLTILVDFEGKEHDVIIEACKRFGKDLFAIRLDTHGGRAHQGAYAYIGYNDFISYGHGPGVTIEEVFNAREWLNNNGCKHTKIIVSSGFNEEKVKAFIKAKAPIDFIGTGSWVQWNLQATSDIFEVCENDKWIARTKVGRPNIDFDVESKQLHEIII